MSIRILLSLTLTLMCTAPGWAGVEEAMDATDRGDYTAAMKEWLPLAQNGLPEAQYVIAIFYRQGLGVPPDMKESARWMQRAAQGGNAQAQYYIGTMYAMGEGGFPVDFKEAVRFFRLGAEQGHEGCMARLGSHYEFGEGVPQDYVVAHMWYHLASAAGDRDAAAIREEVALKMTPAQIAEARRLAQEWKPKGMATPLSQ